MVLVNYPSSSSSSSSINDDDDNDGAQTIRPIPSSTLKRKRDSPTQRAQPVSSIHAPLPPLPAAFHDLYTASARPTTHDDPSLHAGRKRAVPHVEGNWPSHVYLEWYPSPTELTYLTRLIDAVGAYISPLSSRQSLHSLLLTDLSTPRPLHISLSGPINLDSHQRNNFLAPLMSAIHFNRRSGHDGQLGRNSHRSGQPIGPFAVRLGALSWAPNDTRTRWFLTLRVTRPKDDQLNHLLQACNLVARDFGFPELYASQSSITKPPQSKARDPDSPRPDAAAKSADLPVDYTECCHISIAWTLEEPPNAVSAEHLAVLQRENETFKQALTEVGKFEIRFNAVKVKIGNEISSIELSERIEVTDKGILS